MDELLKRDVTRRGFLKRATAMGFGAASMPLLATYARAAAQDAAPLTPAPIGELRRVRARSSSTRGSSSRTRSAPSSTSGARAPGSPST